MKFTLSWLKDHLDTNASLDDISKTLTAIGLEVESISDPAASLKAFTVAKILSAEKHPEADKLQVCKVQSDVGELQIVCGAPNARDGLYVALAKEGAFIPGSNFTIKKTKIRGVESNGMLCSLEELALPGDSSGIIELPEAPIGSPVADALGASDPVIEIAITPNRADCLGVRGIARDLAAVGLGTLKPLGLSAPATSGQSPVTITIATPHCQQFIATAISGVKNGPSPAWLKRRLEAIGQKSISALVDITNYITFDLARPLHVYDAKKLQGGITVRGAKDGEKLAALNGKDYILREGMCIIADQSGPLALGGIIGGQPSGCTLETTDIILEAALFDPVHIAQNGRALELITDARYRFERHVDPTFVAEGAAIATAMICELCGGEASAPTVAGKTPEWKREISFNPQRVKTLGGVDVAPEKITAILTSLGFTTGAKITPPSWRADVEGEADLVEEVLRINGYDNIPQVKLPQAASRPTLTLAQKRVQQAKRILTTRGMTETCTWSFLPEARAKQFGGGDAKLKLLNPISADLDMMRPSLLPNLLEAAQKNGFRGFKDAALCEVGLQFHDITPDGQRMMATGIRTGTQIEQRYENGLFTRSERPVDAFDAKADALAVLQGLGVNKCDVTTNTPTWYHPGRSGALTLGGKIILGTFGELHPGLLGGFDLERAVGFEIFLDALPIPRAKTKTRPALKLSDFQAVKRDFAFLVDGKVTAAEITKAIAAAEKQLITDVAIFDVYTGKGVEPGKKSVAVQVTLQSFERTLSDEDITTVSNAIIAAAKGFGGQLRA